MEPELLKKEKKNKGAVYAQVARGTPLRNDGPRLVQKGVQGHFWSGGRIRVKGKAKGEAVCSRIERNFIAREENGRLGTNRQRAQVERGRQAKSYKRPQ